MLFWKLLLLTLNSFFCFKHVSSVEQTDKVSESSLLQDESPVLLDESNVFDNIKADFRNLEIPVAPAPPLDTDSTTSNLDSNLVEGAFTETSTDSLTLNETVADNLENNATLNETSTDKNATEAKYRCVLKVLEEGVEPTLQVMNASSLSRSLSPVPNITSGECALVIFYSPWCIFSAKAAPQFNALPRLFPHFSIYALDVITYSHLNMRFGLVAIPTLLLFYNGKAVARYNESEPVLEKIATFVHKYTGISYRGNLSVSEAEMLGPLSSVPAEKRDYILVLSWLIIIACSCGWFLQSSLCNKIVEGIRNTWREAEAQHEHVD